MLDSEQNDTTDQNAPAEADPAEPRKAARRAPARRTRPAATDAASDPTGDLAPAKAPRKRAAKKAASPRGDNSVDSATLTELAAVAPGGVPTPDAPVADAPVTEAVARKAPAKRAPRKTAAVDAGEPLPTGADTAVGGPAAQDSETGAARRGRRRVAETSQQAPPVPEPVARVVDQAPETGSSDTAPPEAGQEAPARRTRRRAAAPPTVAFIAPDPVVVPAAAPEPERPAPADATADAGAGSPDATAPTEDAETTGGSRRRRGRRSRGRRGSGDGAGESTEQATQTTSEPAGDAASEPAPAPDDDSGDGEPSGTRRRRRRRKRSGDGEDATESASQPEPGRSDGVQSVRGSTRLEAKRQRRRDGRDSGRRRVPVLTESEFLARREAVARTMAVRQRGDRTQIAVLEDGILVEHYVTKASSTSYAGNVYLGRVQNVLPSMEAAFVDIGKGRNAVLYAGEVNWDEAGLGGKSRAIEQALKSGDSVLVQVTKDPIGHKGARLTSQISLPGRYLVYVPGGSMTGISRKLPDTERTRLKAILRQIVPEDAGVIIRTAAEGASEPELTGDVERLKAQWEAISAKAAKTKGSAPVVLHSEPDLALRVVRDIFNSDIAEMVVSGADVADELEAYVDAVAPDLANRVHRHTGEPDLFADLRVDEQLAKALDRKVWLPSGGTLVIDRTEAMTVVDVNTGKFVGGKGGNLEETVTRNNLEAAEEIVRQLRLRDIGGMVVIDFVDMVLESNRELVLRRLTECLGRDRTRHQVAEVTSLGLVQMTRKRVGQGLLEAFSEPCDHCNGRGIIVHGEPVDTAAEQAPTGRDVSGPRSGRGSRGGRSGERDAEPAPVRQQLSVPALPPGVIPTPAQLLARPAAARPAPAAAVRGGAERDLDTDARTELADEPTSGPVGDPTPADPVPGAVADDEVDVVPTGPAESAHLASSRSRGRRGHRRAAVREAGPPTTGDPATADPVRAGRG